MLSVVGDIPVDNKTSVVTSSISRLAGPTRFFRDTHRGKMCVHVFIGVSVCTSVSVTGSHKKNTLISLKRRSKYDGSRTGRNGD